jgi:hypothetical protein
MARHGNYLDYRASHDEHTDRNLEDRLKNDPTPLCVPASGKILPFVAPGA